jgi:hypothetical protein
MDSKIKYATYRTQIEDTEYNTQLSPNAVS